MAAIMEILEQMVKTRFWKALGRMKLELEICRLCADERAAHRLLATSEVFADNEYVRRHNNAFMVLAVEWGKVAGLLEESSLVENCVEEGNRHQKAR